MKGYFKAPNITWHGSDISCSIQYKGDSGLVRHVRYWWANNDWPPPYPRPPVSLAYER